ncbi:2-dehydropantoate 2-reductase [Sphingobium sp. B11D3B]|uniref:ketopantoate reductase family protein n=1 Tax=Sphingobium sp. B11D3B TaxID=2940575 RepID=UPI0022275D1B|nr:ketopantoate reductase family protein [Sphingobium sp. B11D3B]MCW2387711.1 2-dehydropantoate 2-reductase [Sphingobium sp. B11D3B]
MQSILVIGAGSMGCLFAARIAESGADVLLIDVDKTRIEAIDRDGIHLTDDNGTRTISLRAGLAADAQPPIDLALLFTKGMHSRSAIQSIAHLAGSGTYVLTLQNGLGNPEIVAESFPQDQILKGIAALPADLHGLNGVESHGTGHVELGAMTPAGAQAAQAATALLTRAGFDARYSTNIDVAIWEKVAFNAALNPLGAVTGQPNAGVDNAPGRRIIAAIVDEVVATAKAHGVTVDHARITASIDHALAEHRGHKASMLQDMIAGRASEIDFINGAICDRAQAVGVPAPSNQTMADLVRLMELARR